ncbi:MAG: fumarylacetoacetate hydrolase family protein [Coxiellaceae bacterium]|nr:fumarylacetoacetate hydrolase family protein [Coxiellaceae bacterium]
MRLRHSGVPTYGSINEDGAIFEIDNSPLDDEIRTGSQISHINNCELLAPCQPSKLVSIAINFSGIDGFSSEMTEPMVFIKPATCVTPPNTKIFNPFPELPWWGEAELAVVIKNRIRHVSEEEVAKNILGFTIANDVTVDNIEGRDHHLARSKCPDDFCPLGPWINTEFDSSDCVIEAVQNGEVIRRGRSSQQFWQWPKIITWLSQWITLEPFDVILTGNPPDTVGMRYLAHGDTYTARIDGLGELTNTFHIGINDGCSE